MTKHTNLILVLIIFTLGKVMAQDNYSEIKDAYSKTKFEYSKISGIGHETGVTRRDPSDVIKVDDTYYVYYTKVYGRAAGYWGTVWCAASKDEGYNWTELGEVVGLGRKNTFDSQATFTPNILYANSVYYLYYTGVKPTPGNEKGEFENNSTTDITAIGLAVSNSPKGPFTRVSDQPILKVSPEPDKFDSYRVDDAVLFYRNGIFWLYYKGRARAHGNGGPLHTQLGVAFSKKPEGPFMKLDRPILPGSHEVMLWQQGAGIGALASLSSTLEYAPDGIDFISNKLAVKVEGRPLAMGVYRPDLTDRNIYASGLNWGISMIMNGDECYLTRYQTVSK